MECKTARLLAELRGGRDDELPPEDNAALDQHLAACPDCQRALVNEQRFDAHVARAMKAIPIPPGLKSRLLDRLASDRGAWYRRRFYQVAAAAAAIVIAVGLLTWERQTRPTVDLTVLIDDTESGTEKVNAWLTAQGVPNNLPEPFDPRLLAFHGTAEIKGKQVPILYYYSVERNVFAKVYILKESEFDLSKLSESLSGSQGIQGLQVKVYRDAPAKLVYVILFSGDTLDPFKVKFSPT